MPEGVKLSRSSQKNRNNYRKSFKKKKKHNFVLLNIIFIVSCNYNYVSPCFPTQCCLDLSSQVLKLQGCGEELPFLNPSTDSQCQHDTNENLWAWFDGSDGFLASRLLSRQCGAMQFVSGPSDQSVSHCQKTDAPLSLHHCVCRIETFTMIISYTKLV